MLEPLIIFMVATPTNPSVINLPTAASPAAAFGLHRDRLEAQRPGHDPHQRSQE
jgi:biopolymer transport protein ExbD